MLTIFRQHFDSDVRDMIKVKIVHGFWKRDDGNRIALLVNTLARTVLIGVDNDPGNSGAVSEYRASERLHSGSVRNSPHEDAYPLSP